MRQAPHALAPIPTLTRARLIVAPRQHHLLPKVRRRRQRGYVVVFAVAGAIGEGWALYLVFGFYGEDEGFAAGWEGVGGCGGGVVEGGDGWLGGGCYAWGGGLGPGRGRVDWGVGGGGGGGVGLGLLCGRGLGGWGYDGRS